MDEEYETYTEEDDEDYCDDYEDGFTDFAWIGAILLSVLVVLVAVRVLFKKLKVKISKDGLEFLSDNTGGKDAGNED